MGKLSWIWILIFIILPIIQKMMEAKKQQAKKLQQTRKQIRARAGQRAEQDAAADPIEQLDEGPDADWVQFQGAQPMEPADFESDQELGGGWVEVGQSAAPVATTTVKPMVPLAPGIPVAEGGSGPIEILREEHRGWQPADGWSQTDEDPYEIDRDAHDETEQESAFRGADYYNPSGPAAAQMWAHRSTFGSATHGKHRWRLSRKQLQERIIWAEIFGPPVCLRPPDER
ncbi:MAG: hypothetical protein HRU16_09870 [Planctomycetes bacterium]|nr:hypothetical protein [Planctomycetota bacterium]